jgi:hypothetical protein
LEAVPRLAGAPPESDAERKRGTSVRQYAMRRVLFFVPVMLAVSIITFFGLNLIPGDPALTFKGIEATKEELDEFRQLHNLDHQTCLNNHDDGSLGKVGAVGSCGDLLAKRYSPGSAACCRAIPVSRCSVATSSRN